MKQKQDNSKKHTHKTNEELHREIKEVSQENETLKALVRDILKMLEDKFA